MAWRKRRRVGISVCVERGGHGGQRGRRYRGYVGFAESGEIIKTGIGTALLEDGGLRDGALVVPNPAGIIINADGSPLADGSVPAAPHISSGAIGENTVIGVVATNARLTKTAATKVAQMSNDGIARAVTPAHTMADGDTLFCVSCRNAPDDFDVSVVGHMAAEAVAAAIRHGAFAAEPAYGLQSNRSLRPA